MPRREIGMEELRAIKENINKEGTQMEEGEDGGAAVYVGTKEEVTKARQLVETEGKAPDLESYIVMHKQVVATGEEIKGITELANYEKNIFLQAKIGSVQIHGKHSGRPEFLVFFKDKDDNLAKVEIDLSKIASFPQAAPNKGFSDFFDEIIRQFEGLGFANNNPFNELNFQHFEYNVTRQRVAAAKEEKGFRF